MSSSLADFVNEQRSSKAGGSSFSVASLGSKMSTSFGGFFKPNTFMRGGTSDDTVLLTENGSVDGQLSSSRNRKNGNTSGSWLGSMSGSISSWSQPSEEQNYCGLSRFQRFAAFFLFLGGAAFCFVAALMLVPVLIIQTRKFAALNTLGSVFFIMSFGFLLGPTAYVGFLLSPTRRLVTLSYMGTVLITLYSSLWMKSTVLTMVAAAVQALALLWYLLSYVPGGETGLRFMLRLCTSAVCSLGGGSTKSTLVLPI